MRPISSRLHFLEKDTTTIADKQFTRWTLPTPIFPSLIWTLSKQTSKVPPLPRASTTPNANACLAHLKTIYGADCEIRLHPTQRQINKGEVSADEFYISFVVDGKQEDLGTSTSDSPKRLERPWMDSMEGAWAELERVVEKVVRGMAQGDGGDRVEGAE